MLDLGFKECGSTFEVTFLKNNLSLSDLAELESMSSLAAPRWACLKEETFMVYRKTGDQVHERLPIFATA